MHSKKTVLINVSGHGRLDIERIGGVEKVVLQAISGLTKSTNVVLFGDFPWATQSVKVVSFSKRMGGSLKHVLGIFSYLITGLTRIKKLESNIVIYTHQRNQLLSILYSRIKRVPLIAWELDHDPWVGKKSLIKALYQRLLRNASAVISMSKEQKSRISASGYPEDKIHVVYQGLDTKRYAPSVKKTHLKYILYVAKFLPRKNQLNLLKAFSQIKNLFPDLKLVLVGPKSGGYTGNKDRVSDYYKECSSFIKDHLRNRVTHYEDLSEDQLISCLQNASIYCMPSNEEGFGLSLLEAMSCGQACVVNNISPLTEVIGDTGILVDANSPSAIANAIKEVLSNGALRTDLCTKARSRAVYVFSDKVFEAKLKKIIYQAIDENLRR